MMTQWIMFIKTVLKHANCFKLFKHHGSHWNTFMFLSPLHSKWGSVLYLLIVMLNPDIRALFIMARCRAVDWSPVAKTGFWYMNITSLIGREPNRYRLASRLGFRSSLEWKGGGGRACITLVRCMWAGVFLQVILEVLSVTYVTAQSTWPAWSSWWMLEGGAAGESNFYYWGTSCGYWQWELCVLLLC